jgi:hypothetical protein
MKWNLIKECYFIKFTHFLRRPPVLLSLGAENQNYATGCGRIDTKFEELCQRRHIYIYIYIHIKWDKTK